MSRRCATALAGLLLLSAAVRLSWFSGLQVGDDVVYSKIAVDRLSGTVSFDNVHQMRSGFLLPILAAVAVLGPGEFPLVLYNLLCSVGLVAAVFFLARRCSGDGAGLAAAAVAALHPNLVRFATECHTDTPVALWHALAVLALLAAADVQRPRPLLVLAGLLLGWAWLHKEHAIFLIPFVAGHWLATRRRWTWYLPMALAALAVFLAELAGNAIVAGAPFRRFDMVRYWHAGQYMAEQYPTTASIVHRLLLDLPVRLVSRWQGLFVAAAVLAAVPLLRQNAPGARAIAGWFAAMYLGYSFWPSSLSPFLPGFTLYDWTLPVLQAPLAVLLGAALSRLRLPAALAALAVLGALHLVSIHAAWRLDRRYAEGAREARAWILEHRPARVVSDDKTAEALDFLDGHDPARRYLPFQTADSLLGSFVIVDAFWTRPGEWWSRPVPEAVLRPPPSWIKVYESARLIIYRT